MAPFPNINYISKTKSKDDLLLNISSTQKAAQATSNQTPVLDLVGASRRKCKQTGQKHNRKRIKVKEFMLKARKASCILKHSVE